MDSQEWYLCRLLCRRPVADIKLRFKVLSEESLCSFDQYALAGIDKEPTGDQRASGTAAAMTQERARARALGAGSSDYPQACFVCTCWVRL